MGGTKWTLWGIWMILGLPAGAEPGSPQSEQPVSIRYLRVFLSSDVHLHSPEEVWVEDTLQDGSIRLGAPVDAYRLPWSVLTPTDTYVLWVGDTLQILDLRHLPRQLSSPEIAEVEDSPTSSTLTISEQPAQRERTRWIDTLYFDRMLHLSQESQERLKNVLRKIQTHFPRQIKLDVEGSATPEGDRDLNRQLARWRALQVA
ncbi:MAG: hypothetical protein L3J76_04315, partial [Candidatus Hydrothermae bacterium]|nr:hypothetical protein [Candidatus Hydrothermae bacterium]